MKMVFKAGETPVVFHRNWLTGKALLTTPTDAIELQSLSDISTYFSVSLKKCWSSNISGHDVVIEKTRPLLLAGFRHQHYKVFIDGNLTLEQSGF
jgi:hypothetical protein